MLQALSGIRVVDLTSVILGPLATQLLADQGAEVIKLEPLTGDIMRWVSPFRSEGMGSIFLNLNRGKSSVALNVKHAQGREILLELVATADVFVHSMRAKAAQRLGIGYDALRAVRPDLVYCAAWGFGQTGPYADYPAYDDVVQGASGLSALNGPVGGPPEYVRTVLADKMTGLYAAQAIAAGLLRRERTGRGQFLEVPMLECMTAFLMPEHLAGETFIPAKGAMGYARLLAEGRRPYRTQDGYLSLMPYTTRHWTAFLDAVDRTDLSGADWVSDAAMRSDRIGELYELLAETLPERTTAEWLKLLRTMDVPAMAVTDFSETLTDPHLRAVEMFREYDHPTEGRLREVRHPVMGSDSSPEHALPPQPLGAQTRSILSELGRSVDETDELIRQGVVGAPE